MFLNKLVYQEVIGSGVEVEMVDKKHRCACQGCMREKHFKVLCVERTKERDSEKIQEEWPEMRVYHSELGKQWE